MLSSQGLPAQETDSQYSPALTILPCLFWSFALIPTVSMKTQHCSWIRKTQWHYIEEILMRTLSLLTCIRNRVAYWFEKLEKTLEVALYINKYLACTQDFWSQTMFEKWALRLRSAFWLCLDESLCCPSWKWNQPVAHQHCLPNMNWNIWVSLGRQFFLDSTLGHLTLKC